MKKRIWILISAMALLLAACGDDGGTATTEAAADGGADTTAAAGGEGETINIVANAWTASALNAEIAAQLIEAELGNPVEIVAIDENTMFTGLSDGSLDAVLEVWPSGVVEEEQAYHRRRQRCRYWRVGGNRQDRLVHPAVRDRREPRIGHLGGLRRSGGGGNVRHRGDR